MPPSSKYKAVRSAATDGRLLNPFYRKTQLKRIHDALSENADAVRQAMLEDSGHRPVEAQLEFWLALDCLAKHFESIDPEGELRSEYAISRGEDIASGTEPVGIVVIEPAMHCFLYCLTSALAPALSAGNPVIVHVGKSLQRLPPLALGVIGKALDKDIFQVVHQEVLSSELDYRYVTVRQNGLPADIDTPAPSQVLSLPAGTKVLAVIERDADIPAAADALAMACFSLRGRSPYAPDLVLVNEQIKKEFLLAVSRSALQITTSSNEDFKGSKGEYAEKSDLLDRVYKEGSATVVSAHPSATIVDIRDRHSFLLHDKGDEPCLPILAVTSMEDAIDTSRGYGRSAAIYVFASAPSAKYLCQFMESIVCFVNQIPTPLLFGPRAPDGFSSPSSREFPYHVGQFTVAKQQFVTTSPLTKHLKNILLDPSPAQLESLSRTNLLPPVKRLRNARGVGFFEQGILTGAALFLSVILSSAGVVSYYGWTFAKPRLFS